MTKRIDRGPDRSVSTDAASDDPRARLTDGQRRVRGAVIGSVALGLFRALEGTFLGSCAFSGPVASYAVAKALG